MPLPNTLETTAGQLGSTVSQFADPNFWMGLLESILPFVYGILLLIAAHWVAKLIKKVVKKGLQMVKLDENINKLTQGNVVVDLISPLSKLAYYIIFLMFLPGIFELFGLTSLMTPIQNMIDQITGYIPNIISASVIGTVFYIIAKVGRDLVSSLAAGFGFDQLFDKMGIKELKINPSYLLGTIVFWIVAITGLTQVAQSLDLTVVQNVTNNILGLAGNVLLGTIIISLGLIVAKNVKDLIIKSGGKSAVAQIASIVIIAFIGTIGLQQMNLGSEIIERAFTLFLGALALGTAIAIGLGSKEIFGKLVDEFVSSFKGK